MKYLKGYKIFESKSEWVTSIEEIKEYFYDIEDDYCDVQISKLHISENLEEFSAYNRPGTYPGFIVIIKPKFTNLEFQKYQNYIKEVSSINERLPQHFEKYSIIVDDPDSDSQPTKYKFVFLDVNYKLISWDDDTLYQDTFVRTFGNVPLRYGNKKIHKHGSTIQYQYIEPVGKVKSDVNIGLVKQYLDQKFPDYNIQISEESEGTGRLGAPLITSFSLTCLGKKK